jgi:hypothetical protein
MVTRELVIRVTCQSKPPIKAVSAFRGMRRSHCIFPMGRTVREEVDESQTGEHLTRISRYALRQGAHKGES